jgi:hypothetical protein
LELVEILQISAFLRDFPLTDGILTSKTGHVINALTPDDEESVAQQWFPGNNQSATQ